MKDLYIFKLVETTKNELLDGAKSNPQKLHCYFGIRARCPTYFALYIVRMKCMYNVHI